MKNTISFFTDFINRKGGYIFGATLVARLLSFIASWIALKLIPEVDLGNAIYAFYIISFIIPLAGFGASQGLLKYGAQLKTKEDKDRLFVFVLKKGSLYTLLIIAILLLLSPLLSMKVPEALYYLFLFSFSIYAVFLLEILKIQFRINYKNKTYAAVELVYNVLFVLLIAILSYLFNATGYALAFGIAPIFTFLYFITKTNTSWTNNSSENKPTFEFWKYSFFSSLASVSSQLLFAIDIILIGNILQDPAKVTSYRYVMLIPFSFLILTRVVMATDFVTLTSQIYSKTSIANYIKNYLKIFIIISILLVLGASLFGSDILYIFKAEYAAYGDIFLILSIAVSGVLILKGLFENLLSALGKANIIYWITSIGLIINYILNTILIPKYGIKGAAITTLIVMWGTGIISCGVFYYLYHKEKGNQL